LAAKNIFPSGLSTMFEAAVINSLLLANTNIILRLKKLFYEITININTTGIFLFVTARNVPEKDQAFFHFTNSFCLL
jgi:hypothetical protein